MKDFQISPNRYFQLYLSTGFRLLAFSLLFCFGIFGILGSSDPTLCDRSLVNILQPADDSTFNEGDLIRFSGGGQGCDGGPLVEIYWRDKFYTGVDDEVIFTSLGSEFVFTTDSLLPGIHDIIFEAYDDSGSPGSDSIRITINPYNSLPVVSINTPADGSIHTEGVVIAFDGTATDATDGTLSGSSLQWSSDKDGFLGSGTTVSSMLSIGTHAITLTAEDSGGATDAESITVHVIPLSGNTIPIATIASPLSGTTYTAGDSITFIGTGSDNEDGTLSGGSLVWSSNRDGIMGTGTNLTASLVTAGTHTITLTVTDSIGLAGTDSITLNILNSAPTATITRPVDGGLFNEGAAITFNGSGSDLQDGVLPDKSLTWVSSSDGLIGTGASFSNSTLSAGSHTVTLTAIDSQGDKGTDSVTFSVNTAPTATITSPTVGSYDQGATIVFSGSGSDTEDGILSGSSLVWISSIDGQIGTGSSFSNAALAVGTHTITLLATDSLGAVGTATVIISITSTGAPAIPTGVTAAAFDRAVSISWDVIAAAASYNIYWSNSSGVTTADTKITTLSNSYNHTGLTNETDYFYVVTAENTNGESGISTEVNARPSCSSGLNLSCSGDWSCPMMLESGGFDPSMTIDSSGIAHIVYAYSSSLFIDDANSNLLYRENLCSAVTIDDAGGSGTHSDIDSDSSDNLHVSYDIGLSLGYASKDAITDNWTIETIDMSSGSNTSIAIDDSDYAHIIFQYWPYLTSPASLVYVTNKGVLPGDGDCVFNTDWSCVIIDNDAYFDSRASHTSIVTTVGGDYHIAYFDKEEDLVYATDSSGSLVLTTIESAGNIGSHPDIAVDASGALHIVYMDYEGGWKLRYATNKNVASGTGNCGATKWKCETVTDGGGIYNSIAVDSVGNIHVAYSVPLESHDLRYAVKDASSGTWSVTEPISPDHVRPPVSLITTKSIAVDSNDKAHIVFTEQSLLQNPYTATLYYVKHK